MEKFLKKNSLLIPVIVVSVLVALFFTADNQKLRVLASVTSAKQLINEYSRNMNSLTGLQKADLVKEIDEETRGLGVEYNAINREIQNLKNDKKTLDASNAGFESQKSSISAQISSSQVGVTTLINNQQSLGKQYVNRLKQCNTIAKKQRAACRREAKNIERNRKDVNKQIKQARAVLVGLQRQLSELQYKTNPITNEIKSISLNISAKENTAREMSTVIQSLGILRTQVLNPYNNNDNNIQYEGCTSPGAVNYMPSATTDDGSCINRYGCMDSSALNFDYMAVVDDASCLYEQQSDCLCEDDASGGEENKAEKDTKVRVNITQFGGPNDKVMTATETLSVEGGLGRDLDPDDIYTAWPMPGINEDNPDSPFDLPNVESCFGPETETWKGERIARANEALNNYNAEISYTDSSGNKRTVSARIVDRGPGISTRWDASRGLWNALGLNDVLNGYPNDPNNMVELEVKLVPKDGGSCPAGS